MQPEEMLGAWCAWGSWLRRWAEDPTIGKRRASLVLLTGPVRKSGDTRLVKAALRNVERVSTERDILITNVLSWLLRSLVARHREQVTAFRAGNRTALPAIAVRELMAKLETGCKRRHFCEAAEG
jgi:hypothetical protein